MLRARTYWPKGALLTAREIFWRAFAPRGGCALCGARLAGGGSGAAAIVGVDASAEETVVAVPRAAGGGVGASFTVVAACQGLQRGHS